MRKWTFELKHNQSMCLWRRVWLTGTIIDEKLIEAAVEGISAETFTVLDFMKTFQRLCREDWRRLVKRFGVFGNKRRYTVATYFSNRLDVYSQKSDSLLVPFTRYSAAKFKDYRKTTEDEKRVFGSPWIAVFRKKPKQARAHV